MRIAFAGTPAVAVPTLRALVASGHDVAVVITRPDAPLGRKRVMTPSPVAEAAAELGIEVIKAARLDDATTAQIAAHNIDLGVIVAYGGLVREPLLSTPTHGWINLHFSLLPLWRGAAPVQRSMMANDAVTGVAVFQLVPALDAGDLFAIDEVPMPKDATAGEFLAELAERGAPVVVDVVQQIADGSAVASAQVGEPTTAAKLEREDGRIDWNQASGAVYAHLRGVTPEPGAFTTIDGTPLKVLRAARSASTRRPAPGELTFDNGSVIIGTATAPLILVTVQPAGKAAMAAADWWRGLRTETLKAGS
ncbi:methionyl-tRNA formyltransferase [Microbacterium mitrae]|uniref:Methionyl-tRNA formyltransferase n=1 Tax=Microbacterium mitrae TaxID=664640 RepID=A0A5C8HN42_9MICO|nr:methionyl-tRNA formyltransferase [Microbacterium mitrae]TXK05540.1 methionyl-tRNA formyltransferase [Microbacterium mitrae]